MIQRRRFLSQAARITAGLASTRASATLPAWAAQAFSSAPAASSAGASSLRAHAAAHGLYSGSAVDVGMLRTDPSYHALIIEQCNIVVAENAMKWGPLRPTPDTYFFNDADALVTFGEEQGIKVRGHNLCWHEQLPKWFEATATPANAAKLLSDHIRTVVGRYKGRIRAWDVVNEAILPKDGKPDGLRDSPWFRLLGPGYIELAFRTAREADPHALLTYNEYDIEYDTPEQAAKRAAVLALLHRLKTAGAPLDAVGVQSHLTAASPNKIGPGLMKFVAEAQSMGLKVFITELDVNDDGIANDDPSVRDADVAEVYSSYVTAMLANPAVTDVLTWGLSDNHSWLNQSKSHKEKHPGRQERALLFNASYQPKPAFFALRSALDSRK